jgi:hypothetical protein
MRSTSWLNWSDLAVVGVVVGGMAFFALIFILSSLSTNIA